MDFTDAATAPELLHAAVLTWALTSMFPTAHPRHVVRYAYHQLPYEMQRIPALRRLIDGRPSLNELSEALRCLNLLSEPISTEVARQPQQLGRDS
jgi:hypothetical protein